MEKTANGVEINYSNVKRFVNAEAFIVPNKKDTIGETRDSYGCSSIWDRWKVQFGIDVNKLNQDQKLIQVDVTSPGVLHNWAGIPENRVTWQDICGITPTDKRYLNCFEENFPSEWFANKKEGEIVKIMLPENTLLILTLRQLSSRYRSFGTFEEVMKIVL